MRIRSFALATAIVLAFGCKREPKEENSPQPKGTVFTKIAPAVGSKREESTEMKMNVAMTVAVEGRSEQSNNEATETVKHTDEILAVSGDAITKEKVTFDAVTTKRTEAGKEQSERSPISGKTYVVEAKGETVDVRDEKGGAAPADEEKDVRKYLKNLGKPDPMFAALPKAALVPGQRVDAIAKAVTEQLKEEGDAMTVKDVSVTFREARGDEGIFDVVLVLVREDGPMRMEIDVKGETSLSTKTGAPTRTNLAGPIRVGNGKGSQLGMSVSGSGRMAMKVEARSF